MKKEKSFEDKLRQRIIGEELPFDEGAWSDFQSKYNSPQSSDTSLENVAIVRKSGLMMFLMWLLPTIVIIGVGVFLLTSRTDGGRNNIQDTTLLSSELKIVTTTNKKGELDNTEKRTIDPSSQLDKKSSAISTQLVTSQTTNDKKNVPRENRSIGSNGIKDNDRKGVSNSTGYPNGSNNNSNFENQISERGKELNDIIDSNHEFSEQQDVEGEEITEKVIEQVVLPTESYSSSISEEKNSENKSKKAKPNNPLKNILSIEDMPSLIKPITLNDRLSEIETENMIIPFKFRKNYFKLGLGYAYSLNSVNDNRGTTIKYDQFNLIKIGYERRFSLRWVLGLEASLFSIDNLDVSRTIMDYHQTSTTFEFIESQISHGSSTYLNIPLYIKYNPLGSKYSLVAGINMAYVVGRYVDRIDRYQNVVTNEVIETIKNNSFGIDFIDKFDYGILVGAQYRFWQGLELDVRYNIGLNDISQSFWGIQKTTTNNIYVGLNYNF